jgi:hypothetical protein
LPPVVSAAKFSKAGSGATPNSAAKEKDRIEIEPSEGGLENILKKFG